ncbi:flagellar assembly protein FliH [Massilibacterium senegalense]|uniref:flagellar assembly protein FliH n=1 Tax=Massilibacterium senegalense TaxID=1632858 RepID=UPI00164E1E03|nr:flagellar assembly protein FliH [Massilibacterium senegalense]
MSKIIKRQHAVKHDQGITIQVRSLELAHEEASEHDISIENANIAYQEMLEQAQREVNEMHEMVNQQVEQARQMIDLEKQQWEEERQQWVEQAKQEGYEIGYAQGLEIGQNEYVEKIEQAKQLILLAKEDYYKHIEQAELDIVSIGLKAAEKIIGHQLEEENTVWIDIVKQVIHEVRDQDIVKLYVHPNQYEWTLKHQQELKDFFKLNTELYIIPNVDLQEYGCVVESPFGQIDATIDSQLKELKRKLLEKLEELDDGSFRNIE